MAALTSLILMLLCSIFVTSFRLPGRSFNKIKTNNIMTVTYLSENNLEPTASETSVAVPEKVETEEEKYKREKLAEIAERKAQEVFVTRNTGKFECQACGYVYNEAIGMEKKGIAPGTPFEDIEKFRCPQCGAAKKYFVPETETLSGFKENLKYGFGTNALTGESKQGLIFGGLFVGFLIFMSGYLLE